MIVNASTNWSTYNVVQSFMLFGYANAWAGFHSVFCTRLPREWTVCKTVFVYIQTVALLVTVGNNNDNQYSLVTLNCLILIPEQHLSFGTNIKTILTVTIVHKKNQTNCLVITFGTWWFLIFQSTITLRLGLTKCWTLIQSINMKTLIQQFVDRDQTHHIISGY